jgi:hypothetical protein
MGIESGVQPRTASLLPWILRVGVAGCFIGHGAFGVITKSAWLPYFGVAGIGPPLAWRLMPWIGAMDITIGFLVLYRPCRALLVWAAGWTIWTALLRPLAGEPVWEFFERAGNYGGPIALLMVSWWRGAWFARLPMKWPSLDATAQIRLAWTLRLATAALLLGHAGLGLFVRKAGLAHLYAALGVTHAAAVEPWIGGIELILATLVLARPHPALLLAVGVWKLASEALFPISGAPILEFVERFGSYALPLALAVLLINERGRMPPAMINTDHREAATIAC